MCYLCSYNVQVYIVSTLFTDEAVIQNIKYMHFYYASSFQKNCPEKQRFINIQLTEQCITEKKNFWKAFFLD